MSNDNAYFLTENPNVHTLDRHVYSFESLPLNIHKNTRGKAYPIKEIWRMFFGKGYISYSYSFPES